MRNLTRIFLPVLLTAFLASLLVLPSKLKTWLLDYLKEETDVQPPPQFTPDEYENARVAYQVAVSFFAAENAKVWSAFSAMLVAVSIVIAAASLAFETDSQPKTALVGAPIVGIVLCFVWMLIIVRSFKSQDYFMFAAREIEGKFLRTNVHPDITCRGADFADGQEVYFKLIHNSTTIDKPLQHCWLARCLPQRWLTIFVAFSFLILNIAILIEALNTLG